MGTEGAVLLGESLGWLRSPQGVWLLRCFSLPFSGSARECFPKADSTNFHFQHRVLLRSFPLQLKMIGKKFPLLYSALALPNTHFSPFQHMLLKPHHSPNLGARVQSEQSGYHSLETDETCARQDSKMSLGSEQKNSGQCSSRAMASIIQEGWPV